MLKMVKTFSEAKCWNETKNTNYTWFHPNMKTLNEIQNFGFGVYADEARGGCYAVFSKLLDALYLD